MLKNYINFDKQFQKACIFTLYGKFYMVNFARIKFHSFIFELRNHVNWTVMHSFILYKFKEDSNTILFREKYFTIKNNITKKRYQ